MNEELLHHGARKVVVVPKTYNSVCEEHVQRAIERCIKAFFKKQQTHFLITSSDDVLLLEVRLLLDEADTTMWFIHDYRTGESRTMPTPKENRNVRFGY